MPDWVRNDSVLASTREPTVRPVSPGVAQGHAAAKHQGLSLMVWAGGAVELRSTSPRSLDELCQLRKHTATIRRVKIALLSIKFITAACGKRAKRRGGRSLLDDQRVRA